MTTGRHHVLLIGIDAYDGGGSLNGCVNDIDAIQRLLIQRVGIEADRITRLASPRANTAHETTVPEVQPTLDNIRAALARLGSDEVGHDDRVLVYFSGHGTQCMVSDPTGRRFTREALLPKDKLSGGARRFLFDWELNQAIARIATRTPRTTVILDCCSSGGATRGPTNTDPGTRFFPTTDEVMVDAVQIDMRNCGVVAALGSVARCQVVAACREDQRARESSGSDGVRHGELTRALATLIAEIPVAELEQLHWGRVWRAIDLAVRRANPCQAPWLFGSFGRRLFGFGPDEDGDVGYAVTQIPGAGYEVDAGTLHGVSEGAAIGVYSSSPATFPPLGSAEDEIARVGCVRITEAGRARSIGGAVAPFNLPIAPRGRLVAAGGKTRLRVRIGPADASLAASIAASPLLELVPNDEEVALVRRNDKAWAITDEMHGAGTTPDEPVLAVIPFDRVDVVPRVLEHYLAYVTPLRMARACTDLPGMLTISILDCNGVALDPAAAQEGALPPVRDLKVGDLVCFSVDSAAEVSLSVALFDCAASGRVLLLGETKLPAATARGDGTKVPSRYVVWADATLGKAFRASVPNGRTVGVERLVAIGTTNPVPSLRVLARATTFAGVIGAPRTRRGDVMSSVDASTLDRWTATTTSARIEER